MTIPNITPKHHPVSLVEHCKEDLESATAAAVMWIDKDDKAHFDNCGMTKKDVLWLIECMRICLMEEVDE